MDKVLNTDEIVGRDEDIAIRMRDEDIAIQIWESLKQRRIPSLDSLDINVRSGELTLRGTVASFYEKQVAMSVCKKIPGVDAFIDRISVID